MLLASPALAQCCPAGILTGDVTHVRDGDTIEVGGMAIRLQGLAAPEGNEPGGAEATEAMRAMVLGRELRCELDGKRTYDRCVGVCYLEGYGHRRGDGIAPAVPATARGSAVGDTRQ